MKRKALFIGDEVTIRQEGQISGIPYQLEHRKYQEHCTTLNFLQAAQVKEIL